MSRLEASGLGEPPAGLGGLSLSVSTGLLQRDLQDRDSPIAMGPGDFPGPAQPLPLTPALEELHLRLYRLHSTTENPAPNYEAVMAHISTLARLLMLCKCTLGGLDAREDSFSTRILWGSVRIK